MPTDMISECDHRAADARKRAESTNDPSTKAALLQVEKRWLSLAQSCQHRRSQQERWSKATPTRNTEHS
jgi:hypothetical protein